MEQTNKDGKTASPTANLGKIWLKAPLVVPFIGTEKYFKINILYFVRLNIHGEEK